MLKDLKIKAVYNSEEDNILEDFYIPALENSVCYDRAVGYFDAKMLTTAARGLAAFIENDGYMRLIVGATLTEDEYDAIANGYDARSVLARFEESFKNTISNTSSDLFRHQLTALTWMITHNKLDVKIALRRNGIHHQKIGIMRDKANDCLVFQGSANETNNALNPVNYEVINVFKGWQKEFSEHFEPHIASFNKLWNNTAKNTMVIDVSDMARSALSNAFPDVDRPSIKNELELWQRHLDRLLPKIAETGGPKIPEKLYGNPFELKPHQKKALELWRDNNFQGLFELATGAGKTITSIYGSVKVFESRKRLLTVVSVPYQSLADQWEQNLKLFNIQPLVCYGGEANWSSALAEKLLMFQTGIIKYLAIVVVDATLSSGTQKFIEQISTLGPEFSDYFLFIGDECHHHGAEVISKSLPQGANLRMGLSATPDRTGDEIGNDKIKAYYGDVIHQYTLKDALNDGVLTHYDYHLVPVELTLDEADSYIELSKKIGRLVAMGASGSGDSRQNENTLNMLLIQRSRLVNGSKNKPVVLNRLLSTMSPIKHSLFYCAEGRLDDGDEQDENDGVRQIQIVSELLHKHGWKSSQFTADEKKLRRDRILSDFNIGLIDSLVAMKCLDEGVDIPACSTAFILSSSKKPRQFIQRRGRILRKSFGKEKAVIYDFFATLPFSEGENREVARKLMMAELGRINEFSSLALNKSDTFKTLEPYLRQYDLMHFLA